jgi:predicted transcriptional regulator
MKQMIGIKVDPEVKKTLQKLADKESRNLSNFCYHAIKIYVKEHLEIDIEKETE